MLQKNLNEENNEIKSLAYELYEKHGFKSGNDFVDWLEAEKLAGKQISLVRRKRAKHSSSYCGNIMRHCGDPFNVAVSACAQDGAIPKKPVRVEAHDARS